MKRIDEKVLCQGEWLTFLETTFENKDGEFVKWESIKRKGDSLSVIVVALMVPSQRYVLIKQFRQVLNGYILGFPAGISSIGPDQALQELKEETGYMGKVVDKSPILKSNVGVINSESQVLYVHIDENDPQNKSPQQSLEPAEDIEVVLVPKGDVRDYLLNQKESGVDVGAGLWYFFGVPPSL